MNIIHWTAKQYARTHRGGGVVLCDLTMLMTQRRSIEVPWILFAFLFHFLLGHTGLPLFFADHTQANGSKPKGTKFSKTYKKHAGQGGRQNFHCVPTEGTWKSSGSPWRASNHRLYPRSCQRQGWARPSTLALNSNHKYHKGSESMPGSWFYM